MADWNEFNTFSKYIYPYLESLGYPPRDSKDPHGMCDEQTWVRKRDAKKGPYDALFKSEKGPLVLVEAKRFQKRLTTAAVEQAFDYALGDEFHPVPPPFILVSNGHDHQWFRRELSETELYFYTRTGEVHWALARQASAASLPVEEYSLKRLTALLKKTRLLIFNDLANHYFPSGFSLSNHRLASAESGFMEVLRTRQTYVDPFLKDEKEEVIISAVLSSIALSITLKVLFLKMLADLGSTPFPVDLSQTIRRDAKDYPGILIAHPYDALSMTEKCEMELVSWYTRIRITKALVFDGSKNVLGDIWDALVQSEEQDLQVKTLGNVYTPHPIVKAMTDRAERLFDGDWEGKKILEPSCGSGHFLREIYSRMIAAGLQNRRGDIESLAEIHKTALQNIRAIDIDPFAVQTSQVGMFLELYRSKDLWARIVTNGVVDFSKIVARNDFLDDGFFEDYKDFVPDLVIGNPPYGVSVNRERQDEFRLGSKDSYGCFIKRSIDKLAPSGNLIFIVSSTFLTLKSHLELRAFIQKCILRSVFILHRNAFNRDVFPCLLHIENSPPNERSRYFFFDAWPINPQDPDYPVAMDIWSGTSPDSALPPERFARYEISQQLCSITKSPPSQKDVDRLAAASGGPGSPPSIELSRHCAATLPIVGGLPSIFLMCADVPVEGYASVRKVRFPSLGEVDVMSVRSRSREIDFIKLWRIARVPVGLQTSDNATFVRKTPGVTPNSRRQDIKDVDPRLTIALSQLGSLTDDQKENGIKVVDRHVEPYFVPYDKGGEQDPAGSRLRKYWSNVDYWIDWSRDSVEELKRRNSVTDGSVRRPRFQNAKYYFAQGIRFSMTGLYSPTFELSFGGVFDQKGSLIIPTSSELTPYILGYLNYPLIRYIAKSFIQHSVDMTPDAIRQIPIAVPTKAQFETVSALVQEIVAKCKASEPIEAKERELHSIFDGLFGWNYSDDLEIKTWFARRYYNFGRNDRLTSTT